MRLGIFGSGRLGAAIAAAAREAADLDLVWQVDTGRPGLDLAFETAAPVDVALEATVAEAVPERIAWAQARGVVLVVGTTGWHLEDLAARLAGRPAVMIAPNFSLTVALVARFATILGAFADQAPDRDPYLLEHHHRLKADAPSGTAIRLAEALLAGSRRKTHWSVGGQAPEALNVAVVRAGSEFGRHTVAFHSPAESLDITHRAHSRALFAEGALQAARWAAGRTGLLTMDDFASERLDPLFRQVLR